MADVPGIVERKFPGASVPVGPGRAVISPFQFYAAGEDSLRLVVVNSLAGVRVAVQGRRISDRGTLETFAYEHLPASDRTTTTQLLPLGVGAITNVVMFASAGAPVIGQTYAMLQLVRGTTGALTLLGALLGGPVTASQPLGFPGSPILPSTSVEPYLRAVTGTAPAAGTEITETVPTNARWELLSAWLNLQTSAGAGARDVAFVVTINGPRVLQVPTGIAHAPSERRFYTFANVGAALSDATNFIHSIPIGTPLELPAGSSFATLTTNLQAGDAWDTPRYLVRERLEVT
jgi:hypothetical protein